MCDFALTSLKAIYIIKFFSLYGSALAFISKKLGSMVYLLSFAH